MMRKLKTIEMNRLSVEDFHAAKKLPLVVVLDDVRSMYNVGSIFRTADAFRIEAIYLCGITGCPPHPEIHKTALGAEDSISWHYFPSALEAVQHLHNQGYFVYAVEQAEGSTKLPITSPFGQKGRLPEQEHLSPRSTQRDACQSKNTQHAIVMGNEVKGVHQEVVDACDGCLEIPQFGTKHSMNVAVSAGIVIWEFAREKCRNIETLKSQNSEIPE